MRLNKGMYVEVINAEITHDGDYLRGEMTVRVVSNLSDNTRMFSYPDGYGYLISTDDEAIHKLISSIQLEMRNELMELFDFTKKEVSLMVITLRL